MNFAPGNVTDTGNFILPNIVIVLFMLLAVATVILSCVVRDKKINIHDYAYDYAYESEYENEYENDDNHALHDGVKRYYY